LTPDTRHLIPDRHPDYRRRALFGLARSGAGDPDQPGVAAMKALSLWQPWASLWLTPAKRHETRGWRCWHRGELVVHAARRIERDVGPELAAICDGLFGPGWGARLPVGALVGIVHVTSCRPAEAVHPPDGVIAGADIADFTCGDFSPGRWAIGRGRALAFPGPVAWRGERGLFEVPDAVIDRALWHGAGEASETGEADVAAGDQRRLL
jgi:hypothetical protein